MPGGMGISTVPAAMSRTETGDDDTRRVSEDGIGGGGSNPNRGEVLHHLAGHPVDGVEADFQRGIIGRTGPVIVLQTHPATLRQLLDLVGGRIPRLQLADVTSGLLAEMMTRTYHESQDKPTYTIRRIYGRDDRADEA